jgi:hypothetical protein
MHCVSLAWVQPATAGINEEITKRYVKFKKRKMANAVGFLFEVLRYQAL